MGAWADEGQRSVCGVRRSLSKCEGKCVYAAQCVSAASWVSHFSPLTHSHLSPSVNIYREKCTVICHALGCPAYALCIICMHCTSSFIYICIVSLWCADECPLIGKTLFCRNYLHLFLPQVILNTSKYLNIMLC